MGRLLKSEPYHNTNEMDWSKSCITLCIRKWYMAYYADNTFMWHTMLLSRHSVGTYLDMSPHATCQETFGHGRLSLRSQCGLILAQRVESDELSDCGLIPA